VPNLLMLASGVGLAAATAALWVQGWRAYRRFFAFLVSIAVTVSLFSVVAWGATEIAQVAPLPLTWIFVGTLALLFALRLYRQLQDLPPNEARVLSNRAKLSASGDEPTAAFSSRLERADRSLGRMDTSLSTAEDGGAHV
jgi:hypothetical protein